MSSMVRLVPARWITACLQGHAAVGASQVRKVQIGEDLADGVLSADDHVVLGREFQPVPVVGLEDELAAAARLHF